MLENFNHVCAVILSGGSGTRFWPKSTRKNPKQLCNIADPDLSMIEQTLERLDNLIPPERRIIVTHKDQIEATQKIVKDRCAHYVAEPSAKNTAAALALACLEAERLFGNTVKENDLIMISLHADHVIETHAQFQNTIKQAVEVATADRIVLIGIKPDYPETGYGYIEQGPPIVKFDFPVFEVSKFREKPDLATAKEYITAGKFLWNSGLFVWKIKTITKEFKNLLPKTFAPLHKLFADKAGNAVTLSELEPVYNNLAQIAIDSGIFEISKHISVIKAQFSWQDMGHWAALEKHYPTDANKNLLLGGEGVLIDCENTTVCSDGTFVATLGVKDIVVVSVNGAILVCHKSKCQDVKEIVAHLKAEGKENLY